MTGKDLPIIRQLAHDFPGASFDYTDNHLIVNGEKIRTFLSPEEIADQQPVKQGSRSYYQLFCNIVYNHFHVSPEPGTYADLLIIDEEEERKGAIRKWFAEKRLAFLEDDGDVAAIEYEIEGDRQPVRQIVYDVADEVEPVEKDEAVEELEGIEESVPSRTPEEQAKWEKEMKRLKTEGEAIKKDMNRDREREIVKKKSPGKRVFNFFRRGTK